MRIVKPFAAIITHTDDLEIVIEGAGRVCYKSEDKITSTSAANFIQRICNNKHESVLEHGAITVHIQCDRGVSHELVRHRIASFSQESTRYCNYGKEKFGKELTFIKPCFWEESSINYSIWYDSCLQAEKAYFNLLGQGATPQEARSILPNSLKTEIMMTANPREWRHIFKLRTAREAHPQMREIMIPLQEDFCSKWPAIFGEVRKEKGEYHEQY